MTLQLVLESSFGLKFKTQPKVIISNHSDLRKSLTLFSCGKKLKALSAEILHNNIHLLALNLNLSLRVKNEMMGQNG